MRSSVHGGENGANEVVVNHDAVQDGDGPLHTVLVLDVFKRRYDGDERSEALETAFNALGGRGGWAKFREVEKEGENGSLLSPPFTMLHWLG
jgi:hypothetical protein